MEVKEPYQAKISNRFAALENLGDSVVVAGTWNSVTQNTKNLRYRQSNLLQNDAAQMRSDDTSSKFVHQRKQAKLGVTEFSTQCRPLKAGTNYLQAY